MTKALRQRVRSGLLLLIAVFVVLPVHAQSTETSREQKGILESGLYESPQFSAKVTWSEHWEVDDDGSQSDKSLLVDQVSLNYKNQGTAVIMFIEAGGESPDDYARRLIRYRRVAEPDARLVWSDEDEATSVLLYETVVDNRDLASLIEIRLVDNNETLQVVELLLYPEYAESVFDIAQSDINIDGQSPFSFVDAFPLDKLEE